MRWGRHGVKSARWIVRSSSAIGGPIGAIAFDAQGNVLNVDHAARSARAAKADNDVVIAGISDALLPVG